MPHRAAGPVEQGVGQELKKRIGFEIEHGHKYWSKIEDRESRIENASNLFSILDSLSSILVFLVAPNHLRQLLQSMKHPRSQRYRLGPGDFFHLRIAHILKNAEHDDFFLIDGQVVQSLEHAGDFF